LALTHWSSGQLCSLANSGNSPASYFRDANMPAPMIADCPDTWPSSGESTRS
jgi:hypothetical protein